MVNEPPDYSKQAEAPRPLVGAEQGREKKPHVVQWAAGAGGSAAQSSVVVLLRAAGGHGGGGRGRRLDDMPAYCP